MIPLRARVVPLLCAALTHAMAAPHDPGVPRTALLFPAAPDSRPNYRIPAILQVPGGDLLIFAERRNDGPGDVGDHDIVLRRSPDGGESWREEETVLDDGPRTCTDVTVGFDRETRALWLFFLRDKRRFSCLTSDDGGHTWNGPRDLHPHVIDPAWETVGAGREDPPPATPGRLSRAAAWASGWHQRYGIGPGNTAIQLARGPRAGRLLVPARHREEVAPGKLRSFCHTFHSDDHGRSWRRGASLGPDISECQIAELVDGAILLVARDESSADAPDNLRHRAAISRDGGGTWSEPRRAEELITPRCHGALERFSPGNAPSPGPLLFTAPASPRREPRHPYGRRNLSARFSLDEGATWSAGVTLYPHPSAYSDIATLDDGTVAVVYERGPEGSTRYWDEIALTRFPLTWLREKADSRWDSRSPMADGRKPMADGR